MPAPNAIMRSPPPAPQAGSSRTPSPPSPSSSALHQVGARQATRSRTRTRRNMSGSIGGAHRTPQYTNEEHPLSAHNLAKQGYHSFRCLGVPFHVKQRYTFLRELGIGAYGCVALCWDSLLDCNVAIKKVTRVFERDVLARRALREVAVLRHIGMCDNVTALLDFDTTFIEFSEIYLVLSASEADLSQIIRSGQALSDAHLQYFVAQILRGVRFMHAAKVVHRDLKPGNLLVNADCALRLCDFGLARAYADPAIQYTEPAQCDTTQDSSADESLDSQFSGVRRSMSSDRGSRDTERDASNSRATPVSRSMSPKPHPHIDMHRPDPKGKQRRLNYPGGPLTEYVATRWYRAPEVMLCFQEGYGLELDMWSVGCILAELIAGKPIFAGKDYVDQIARINNVLGSPQESVLDKIGSERAKTYIKSLPKMPAVPFGRLYPNASPEAVDLLSKLLTWDPAERLSADEALRHPWLKAYHESNARWEAPPAFDKFAEVEYIRSLREFKHGLQREADELRMEVEALENEEADAGLDATVEEQNGAHAHKVEETEKQSGVSEDQPAITDVGDAAIESGNGPRADADKSQSEAEQPQGSSASSGTTSAHSCHLPVSVASSGSSSHNTLSSTETSSADEADPPSPRAFDSCRINSINDQVAKAALGSQPTPFFQLGHEEEGRYLPYPFYDETNDVFMPEEILRVAQGLVEHQIVSAAAAAVTTKGDSILHVHVVGATDKIPARSCSNGGDRVVLSGRGQQQSAPSRSSNTTSTGMGGSTPSLGQGLLDNTSVIPASGSSSVTSHSSHRQSKQLVLIQDGLIQSSAGLLAEIIARNSEKGHPTVLVSVLRDASTYIRMANANVTILDVSGHAADYGEENSLQSCKQFGAEIFSKLESVHSQSRLTVILDSLDTIAEQSEDGVDGAYGLVRLLLAKMNTYSRLVVGIQGDSPAISAALVSALNTPLVWGLKGAEAGSAAAAGTILTARLHAPAVLRFIHRNYGLQIPSTSAAVAKAIASEAGDVDFDGDEDSEVDVRFWDILRNIANRGALGIPAFEAGGGTGGWWADSNIAADEVEGLFKISSDAVLSKITFKDLVSVRSNGFAFLELRYQARSGKMHEELIGCVVSECGRLSLRPLNMTDRRGQNSAPHPSAADSHASMVSTLPFNLSKTDSQRARRDEVPLPYAYHMRGSTGNSTIFFEPEAGDDEDDEDPDDDLDF